MGANSSTRSGDMPGGGSSGGGSGGFAGHQLFISLKMEGPRLAILDLAPHVFGSASIGGALDPADSLAMRRESTSTWELTFVIPPNHATIYFKFVLKPKDGRGMVGSDVRKAWIVEEGPVRQLSNGKIKGGGQLAAFHVPQDGSKEDVVECGVFIEDNPVSPLELAASWRAHQENLQPSMVRGIPDVVPAMLDSGHENEAAAGLDLDLDQYLVPSPRPSFGSVYAANLTEDPRSISSMLASSNNNVGSTNVDSLKPDIRITESPRSPEAMPAAAGAVAAAAVADLIQGSKENNKLAIVLVGLPARGKTFTAAKLTRYLRWLGHDTKHFNVGKYRRLKHGVNQTADFFRADNKEGLALRNEVAALAMEDLLAYLREGGQVGILDATNSTKERRTMLMKMAEGECKIIFLETICNDQLIIERNIRLKVQQSPDYEQTDYDAAVQDFKQRLANYEKVYEPVEEGSYIKMIDRTAGNVGQLHINNISGYVPARIVFFLVNTHLTPRSILLTRHGESMDNVRGRIGGDSFLSETGGTYAKRLANFIEKRLSSEITASIWTSTLQRTILTATPIVGFPKIQWRALDEINAGVCDGMTYEEIKTNMPQEYESRKKDKLRYRYPRGESYLDVIQRLEPVIIELERQRSPVVVISHQAVLRSLYAYFMDKPLNEIPHIEVPLHTIIEIQMGFTGVQEKRYKLD